MASRSPELKLHTLEQRASFLMKLAQLQKQQRYMEYHSFAMENGIKAFEAFIVEVILRDKVKCDFSIVVEALEFLVKIHNHHREVWNPKTYVEKIYHFKTDITEQKDVLDGFRAKTASCDNLGIETDALSMFFRRKGINGLRS